MQSVSTLCGVMWVCDAKPKRSRAALAWQDVKQCPQAGVEMRAVRTRRQWKSPMSLQWTATAPPPVKSLLKT